MTDAVALHRLLLDNAERMPDAPAYGPRGGALSYADLAERAARVAGTLREAGLRRGARVVVGLDGCAEYLVACYGALMAGAAVVPIAPETRAAGLGHVLRHSDPAALIAERRLLARLHGLEPSPATLRVVLEADEPPHRTAPGPSRWAAPGRPDPAAPGRPDPTSRGRPDRTAPGAPEGGALGPNVARLFEAEHAAAPLWDEGARGADLAGVHYTSGTTGAPKGVMLSHANIVANVLAIVRYLSLGPEDRAAMVLPYHYVYGSSVLHTHLAAGGSIVPAGSMAYPVRVLETVWRERCTGLSGVPSTFASLLRAPRPGPPRTSPLRYLTQAGGPMAPALAARVRDAYPEARLFLMYGQTEASARLSYLPPDDLERKPGSVGIPVPGVRISIVDANDRPVEAGILGEVVAAGPNVMTGYLNDPAATARALRGGVLHTGDVGWLDGDGYLYVAGRYSEMISSGGHRIGPQEIEDVVTALPEVDECAAVGVEDEMLGQRIVVVVVPRDGARPHPRDIRRACLSALPRYKVPTEVRLASELPRSERGKLLRTSLRDRLEEEARACGRAGTSHPDARASQIAMARPGRFSDDAAAPPRGAGD